METPKIINTLKFYNCKVSFDSWKCARYGVGIQHTEFLLSKQALQIALNLSENKIDLYN
jgi:hypothetical protein